MLLRLFLDNLIRDKHETNNEFMDKHTNGRTNISSYIVTALQETCE